MDGFGGLFAKELGMSEVSERSVGVWVRAASEGLSVPMTIVWGLETLNRGDESWTKKEVLEIHVCTPLSLVRYRHNRFLTPEVGSFADLGFVMLRSVGAWTGGTGDVALYGV